MKRITLSALLLTMFSTAAAAAQNPPTPPTPPARTPPTPSTPRARVAPVAPRPWDDFDFELRAYTMAAEIAPVDRELAASARELNRESARAAAEIARATAQFDVDRVRENAREMAESMRGFAYTPIPAIPAIPAMPAISTPFAYGGDRFDRITAPPGWAPTDPADSLYNLAREMLNRGDWGRAARMFADIQKNYPKSVYEKDALYYEAYARYKIGTTDELRQAARILEPVASRLGPATDGDGRKYVFGGRRASDSDILGLYARINGQLAMRGDADAAAKIAKAASTQGSPCDQDDIQVRTEALSALSQTDPQQALPLLKRVLEHKDDCSASLRRNAVLILGRRADAEAASLLLQTAKTDPNTTVRTEAVSYLSRVPGDAGLSALEEMLRTEQDERVQAAAIRALMSSDNARARASMRALIDRKDAPLRLRVEAINSFRSDRTTADDAAYLRGLFGRADSDQLKNAILGTVSRLGGAENDQWLMSVARSTNESSSVRSNALSQLSRSPTLTTGDLSKMYDAASESFELRQRIINLLAQRRDQESTDKLLEIAKSTTTVVDNRKAAINALMNRKDPRATQLLLDIIDGKKP